MVRLSDGRQSSKRYAQSNAAEVTESDE